MKCKNYLVKNFTLFLSLLFWMLPLIPASTRCQISWNLLPSWEPNTLNLQSHQIEHWAIGNIWSSGPWILPLCIVESRPTTILLFCLIFHCVPLGLQYTPEGWWTGLGIFTNKARRIRKKGIIIVLLYDLY